MMIKTKRLAVSVAVLLLAQGALACDYPERVKNMPDGNSATRDEMIDGKKAVQSYIAAFRNVQQEVQRCCRGNEPRR